MHYGRNIADDCNSRFPLCCVFFFCFLLVGAVGGVSVAGEGDETGKTLDTLLCPPLGKVKPTLNNG